MKVFHHNDLDGRCAAAIAWKAFSETASVYTNDGSLIEMDYHSNVNISDIQLNEAVIIVDFSFKPEVMKEVLKRTSHVIWIDHHKTAFEYNYGVELDGIRKQGLSGCELAWEYFYPDDKMPYAVKLIGDRDCWRWELGLETAKFNTGMMIQDQDPTSEVWADLFVGEGVQKVIDDGIICLAFRDNICADYTKLFGWETEFEGYKCFANGMYAFGSEGFGERFKQYDICLSYEYLGDKWIVGLYSETVDVSEIAVKYGGGGHEGAAGFNVDVLPFTK